jgi:hypothetical protein
MDQIEIKWANAAELGHMTQMVSLLKEDQLRISEFLVIANETHYNEKLEKLKTHFLSVPDSKTFMDALQTINEEDVKLPWQRWFPIEETPTTHILHASYLRVPSGPTFITDLHRGLPMPDIFHRTENILVSTMKYTIGDLKTFYYILKPFGYNFPSSIWDKEIQFRLFDISNPHYVKLSHPESRFRGGPTPIYKNGKPIRMMTDKEYMAAYKKYLLNLELEQRQKMHEQINQSL